MKRIHSFILWMLVFTFGWTMAGAQQYTPGISVIVIDAGHGGAFPGAVYGGVKEKDINLAIALKLGALLEKELPEVKIVYTRKTDTDLGSTLNADLSARANIANKAGGDFFISIHANSSTKSSVHGTETLIMGESSKEAKYNEDAIIANNKDEIIDMSDSNTAAIVRAYIQNLQFTYGQYSETMARLMQKHYARNGRKSRDVRGELLKVLYATDMPSVLTEVGFMSNSQELKYITSQKGQNEIARMLCDAVKEYVEVFNSLFVADEQSESESDSASESEVESEQTEPVTVVESVVESEQETVPKSQSQTAEVSIAPKANYTIQIAVSEKQLSVKDPWFKSYRGKVVCRKKSGRLPYKYYYGEFATAEEAKAALPEVKKSFRDAYVVPLED